MFIRMRAALLCAKSAYEHFNGVFDFAQYPRHAIVVADSLARRAADVRLTF
jgi:hypothetical protein